jgi:hypothetical protein
MNARTKLRTLGASMAAAGLAATLASCGNIDDEQAAATDDQQGAVSGGFSGARRGGGTTAAATPPSYGGGAVLPNPRVVTVFWGSNVSANVRGSISGFYSAVLDSAYFDWLDEYGSTVASNGPIGRGTNAGNFTITPGNTATSLTEASIGTELAAQINANHLPAPTANVIYMVYFPSTISITASGCGTSCVDFCACHESTTQRIGTSNVSFPYAIIPDFSSASGCSSGCGSGTEFQNVSYASSHELVEAVTDPFPFSGWAPEIGDGCNQQTTTVRASDGTSYTVQTEFSAQSSSCIASRPDCQRISDTYGVAANVTFGSAPSDVRTWWTGNSCNTSPSGVSADLCQKASDVFGIVANSTFGFAPSDVQTWWTSNHCATSPLVSKSLCQRAADSYGIVANQTWGAAPASVRTFWTSNSCNAAPVGQDPCQKAADLYGIVANVSFGFAPSDVQTWWTANKCGAATTSTLAQQCQNASDLYAIVANTTFGGAPASVQTWWTSNHCGASPRCQDESELYGVNAGVTFAFAPSFVQTWWSSHSCATKPLFSANSCQRAADTFGIVANSTFGFAPSTVRTWWTSNSCTQHPRERLRRAFSNGPTP